MYAISPGLCSVEVDSVIDYVCMYAGFSGCTVGQVATHFTLLPIPVVTTAPRKIDPLGKAWNRLRAAIGQPNFV